MRLVAVPLGAIRYKNLWETAMAVCSGAPVAMRHKAEKLHVPVVLLAPLPFRSRTLSCERDCMAAEILRWQYFLRRFFLQGSVLLLK